MNINLKRTGEVTFQVALTNEQIETHLPKPTFDKDLQYSCIDVMFMVVSLLFNLIIFKQLI